MLRQGSGVVINVASVNGPVAQAGRTAYCLAKGAGVIRLTEVLVSEWASHRVRVKPLPRACSRRIWWWQR
jgi:NAD(P)-dependent dehydrogenase (short-subunit alcohol dehydrogenase family)